MWNTFANTAKSTLASRIIIPISVQLGKTFYTKLCSLHTVGTANSIKGLYCTTPDTISSKIIDSMQQTTPDSACQRKALSNYTSFKSIRQIMSKLRSSTRAHHNSQSSYCSRASFGPTVYSEHHSQAVLTGSSLDWRQTSGQL